VRRHLVVLLLLVGVAGGQTPALQDVSLPGLPNSVKFAVIGDNGNGEPPQFEVARQMAAARATFPFPLVIMLGDNMYGRQSAQDFVAKFERPYSPLLKSGVRFRASLGNHDDQRNRFYAGFSMNGERYYTYREQSVRFFALDTNQLDPRQLAWLDEVLRGPAHEWKICYFHHPLYSNARRHGSDVDLRVILEPLFVKHGVDVVFAGHDHVYERIKPQKGITHFVNGSSGELRKGDVRPSATTAAYFDQDHVFTLVEVAGDEMFFQARSRGGRVVDSGVIRRHGTIGSD
jgi:3',5'-cyclic AMP phosphodiesterase CpdA